MLAEIHRYADGRFGLVTRDELHGFGLSDKEIFGLLRDGSILRIHRAVYRLPASGRSVQQDALGACLAIGAHAFASHRTAGLLWPVTEQVPDLPEVLVPARYTSRQKTVKVYRTRHLDPSEIARIGPIRVTRVARTISDLATVLDWDDLEDALDESLRRKIVTPRQLAKYSRLRELAEDRMRSGVPGSRLERRGIAALRRAGLPEPVPQLRVTIRGKTYKPDLSYPDRKIAIELEGEGPHWGKKQWQYDHERDRAFELSGWRVLPYTWQDANEGSFRFVMEVGEILALRPIRWTSAAQQRWPPDRRGRREPR